jgi:hypothetical protein
MEVAAVERAPLEVAHYSGNTLERVTARLHGAERRFVLKRFSIERDWIMRLTHDQAVREVALFRHGVYARLPATCYVPIIAAARDGNAWASLMTDVSPGLAADEPLTLDDLRRYLAHLAALHARFLHDDALQDPALGLSSLRDFMLILAPTTVQTECAEGRGHPVLQAATRGWSICAEIAPAVMHLVEQLERDLHPLMALIERMPHTLLHGDFKAGNLGVWPPATAQPTDPNAAPRTIMLDWQDATYGAPLLDLGYFLAISASRLPVTKEAAIELYCEALAHCGYSYAQPTWERDRDVGLLAGGALRLLWQKALGTQTSDPILRQRQHEELRWWCDLTLRASRWLG